VTGVVTLCLAGWLAQAPVTAAGSTDADAARAAAEAARDAAVAAKAAAEASARAAEALQRPLAAETPALAAKETKKADEIQGWSGTGGLSLISLTGNANTLTFSGSVSAERRWTHWLFGLKTHAIYGQTRPVSGGVSEVAALAAGGQLRGDRFVTERISAFVLGGAETDHVKSVELRAFVEGGTGITWWAERAEGYEKALLRTDLALRYSRESRFQYYPTPSDVPDADLLGPRIGATFRYALSKDVLFTEELELLPSVIGSSRLVVNSSTKLSSTLVGGLALAVSFLLNHDTLPAPGKLPTDTALTVGLEFKL
jgi:hypothetical protein